MTYGKTLWHKTMRLLLEMCGLPVFLMIDKVPHELAQREEMNLEILLVFFDRISYQRVVLYQKVECVLVAWLW